MNRIATFLRVAGVPLLLLFAVAVSARVYADQYNVDAVVPYPAPTQQAVIQTPTGSEVHDAQQIITGSCEVADPYPAFVVSIWRSGISLGSGVCDNGAFSITVMLREGLNTLIARTITVTSDYGPDSSPTEISLVLPIAAKPLPPSQQQPTTPTDKTSATNQAGLSGLVVSTAAPFALLTSDKVASIEVIVVGGQSPHSLELNWGDGSVETHSLAQPGTYTYGHTYLVQRNYTVALHLRDATGAYVEYSYAVVSNVQRGTSGGGQTNTQGSNKSTVSNPWLRLGYLFIVVLVAFSWLTSYWFGWKKARNQYESYMKKSGNRRNQHSTIGQRKPTKKRKILKAKTPQ